MLRGVRRWRNPVTLPAVDIDDLSALVDAWRADGLIAEEINCAICKEPIALPQIAAIIPRGGDVLLFCAKESCLSTLCVSRLADEGGPIDG